MRISLVSEGDLARDPRARALARSLATASHTVVGVDWGATPAEWLEERVLGRVPPAAAKSRARRRLRRFLGEEWSRRTDERSLSRTVARAGTDLMYPMSPREVPVVDSAAGSGAVVAPPGWPDRPVRDIVRLAPHEAVWSTSAAGPDLSVHVPGSSAQGRVPSPGRHDGRTVVVVYRRTTTSPGRYLESALHRAGVTVVAMSDLDWDAVPPEADTVVIVESPYPAAAVRGRRNRIPLLFWIHHGEHHLAANLRLVDRYRPDAVLLAHSWHLAHRFPVPVHRFPFAVAPELHRSVMPYGERPHDVAMVGAGLHAEGSRYDARRALVAAVTEAFGERAVFPERLTPEDLGRLYGSSRIVVNEGGSRHFPITMRVFEAIGSGALLLTEDLPGTDTLFDPDAHYAVMGADPVADIRLLLAGTRSAEMAASARQHAALHHTYDHRVDELLELASQTTVRADTPWTPPADPLAALILTDTEVQTLVTLGTEDLVDSLPTHVVWDVEQLRHRLGPGRIEAAALGGGRESDLELVVASARRYVYARPEIADAVAAALARFHPHATITRLDGILRADLHLEEGYKVRRAERGETK